jgi:peptidyl-prolyl cis-trans isomerase SurA
MPGSRVVWSVALIVLLVGPPAVAQVPDSQMVTVDRIVAVVGNTPITASRVEEEVNVQRQQGLEIPTDSADLVEFKRGVLERIIEQELLVQAALQDTLVEVAEQELQQAVEAGLGEIRDQFPSALDYARELRKAGFDSPEDYRLWYTEQKRRELLQQALFRSLRERGDLRPVQPTDAELRTYYNGLARKPTRPATVSFRQIIVQTEADSAAWAAALIRADSVWGMVRKNKDQFGTLARQYSDDPSSAERGGELGFFRRGQMVREFEAVAFRMRPGQVSPPVRSPFGYHIIEVQRVEPAEVQSRHILIAPEITEEDRAKARRMATRAKEQLEAGGPYDSLQRIFHDRREQAVVEDVGKENLPPVYREALEGAVPGQVIGPIELGSAGPSPPKYAIILFERERPEGELSFEDLREQLRDRVSQESAFERYIERLKQKTYIDVRL